MSVSADVASYVILRKRDSELRYDTLALLASEKDEYTDDSIEEGVSYYYALAAVDYGGLCSPLSNIVVAEIPAKAEKVTLNASRTSQGVRLSWNGAARNKTVGRTVIYRTDPTGNIHSYATTQGTEYTDTDISTATSYSYYIRYQYSDGSESPMSNEVKISF